MGQREGLETTWKFEGETIGTFRWDPVRRVAVLGCKHGNEVRATYDRDEVPPEPTWIRRGLISAHEAERRCNCADHFTVP
jgi:hypothetical protein